MKDDIVLIDKLLKLSEGKDLDFKSTAVRLDTDYHKAKFVRNIICMANTPRDGSAFIIIGVVCNRDGTKNLVDVPEHPDDNILQQLVASRVGTAPQFQYRPVTYNGRSLGIIEIFPYKGGPFIPQFDFEHLVNRGAIYYRQGSSTKIASSSLELREIINWMENKGGREVRYSNLKFIDIGGGVFDYPCYFPSISSMRTQNKPLQYLKILIKSNYPWFLISAYDIYHSEDKVKQSIIELMKEALSEKKVLLDSGYFESSSRGDERWSQSDYWEVLKSCDFSYAFSFDRRNDNKGKSHDDIAKEIVESWKTDIEKSGKDNIIPIIHSNEPSDFIKIIPRVVQATNPIMIAVPERELGDGIISTTRTIFEIRKTLNEMKSSCPVHLLGTGNPISILIYSICGANSYDGLEWCQMISNFNSAQLYHLKHYDFLESQSGWVSDFGVKWGVAALMHNIEFYSFWMTQIHTAIKRDEIIDLLKFYLPLTWNKKGQIVNPLDLLTKAIPELFQSQEAK